MPEFSYSSRRQIYRSSQKHFRNSVIRFASKQWRIVDRSFDRSLQQYVHVCAKV